MFDQAVFVENFDSCTFLVQVFGSKIGFIGIKGGMVIAQAWRRERVVLVMKMILTVSILGLLSGSLAHAALFDRKGNPLPESADPNSGEVNWEMPSIHDQTASPYNAVGLVRTDIYLRNQGNADDPGLCSGVIIATKGKPDRAAYAITAGHCFLDPVNQHEGAPWDGYLSRAKVKSNSQFKVTMSADLSYYFDRPASGHGLNFSVNRIEYGTQLGTDIMIVKLGVKYQDLVSHGFHPIAISAKRPARDDLIQAVGVPGQDMNARSQFLHVADCRVLSTPDLIVAEPGLYRSPAYEVDCSGEEGMSGAPVISQLTHQVVGLIAAGGDKFNFAIDVSKVPGCFNADGEFNLKLGSCELPGGGGQALSPGEEEKLFERESSVSDSLNKALSAHHSGLEVSPNQASTNSAR